MEKTKAGQNRRRFDKYSTTNLSIDIAVVEFKFVNDNVALLMREMSKPLALAMRQFFKNTLRQFFPH